MQAAIDAYASAVGGAVTGRAELVDDSVTAVRRPEDLAPFTIVTRVFDHPCGTLGCATFGPAPRGPNAAIVNLDESANANTIAHELLHAYGLSHVLRVESAHGAFAFLMNPIGGGHGLTDAEKAAIAAAHAGGIRGGTTRDQALALGLVLPYVPGSAALLPSARFDGGFVDDVILRRPDVHIR